MVEICKIFAMHPLDTNRREFVRNGCRKEYLHWDIICMGKLRNISIGPLNPLRVPLYQGECRRVHAQMHDLESELKAITNFTSIVNQLDILLSLS